jgi:hypothetical protein
MRRSLLGVSVGSLLVLAATAICGSTEPETTGAREFTSSLPSPALTAHVSDVEGQPQVVTIIDAQQRVLAVYHVDRASGEITLKSVRNLTWDLQMLEYNSGAPLPQDIRNMRRGLQP